MPFSGLHVACFYAATNNPYGNGSALASNEQWSETMAVGGTTTHSAPASQWGAVFRVRASVDSYVSNGATPDATQVVSSGSPRYLVPGGVDYDFFAKPNDKRAWITA